MIQQTKQVVGHWASETRRPAGVWRDRSMYAHNGDLVGAVNWSPSGRRGLYWCREHDGIADNMAATIPDIQPPFTLAAWFKGPDLATTTNVITGFTNAALTHYHCLITTGAGRIGARTFDGAVRDAETGIRVINNRWHFGVGVWGMVNHSVSIDGRGLLDPTGNGVIANTDVFKIGVSADVTPFAPFEGQITDAWLFNWALSYSEYRYLYLHPGDPAGRFRPRGLLPESILSRTRNTTTYPARGAVMPLSFVNDYKYIDGKVDITLDGNVVRNVVMLQSAIKEGDASKGAYLHRETTFQLPTVPVVATPEVGQVVVAAGISYTVLKVREPFLADYWGLTTRERSITADTDLQNQVTLYAAVHALQDAGWTRTTHPTAHATFADVPAKVQLQTSHTEDKAAKRGFKKIYHIFVSEELPTLKHGDLIKDEDSKQYTIDSWKNRQRIDEYSVIICSTPPGS